MGTINLCSYKSLNSIKPAYVHIVLASAAALILQACCNEDSDCDDGIFCNGQELCINFLCNPGDPPVCDDSVDCTEDSCNEDFKACVSIPDDAFCSDGLFCSGEEYCDLVLGCMPGEPPDCSDEYPCTHDSCDEVNDECSHDPDDALCADGDWCDGDEICNPDAGCEPGPDRDCDDSVDCTVDTCDEDIDVCINTPDDAFCADELFCTENERCDPVLGGCVSDDVLCDDGIDCTEDTCSEVSEGCVFSPNDAYCDDANECTDDVCDSASGCRNPPVADGTECEPYDGTTICVDGHCTARSCGDGFAEPLNSDLAPEECDDGNDDNEDGCTSWCTSQDFQVNTSEEGEEKNPSAVVLEDGGFVIAFEDETYTSPDYTDVRFRRYDRHGNSLDIEDRILGSSAAGIQIQPDLAALPAGNFAAAWADNSSGGGDLFDIILRLFDETGSAFRTTTVNLSSFGSQLGPKVEYFAFSDVIMVAWEDQSTLAGRVKFRRYDGDGFSLDSDEQIISSEALFHESQPAMAEASDGRFLFAWTGSEDGSTTQIFARLFSASAMPLGVNFIIPSDPCYQNYDPHVAWTEGEGKFVLVWERLCPGDFFSQVAATLVDPDDLSTVPEPLALAADSEEVFSPSVSTSFLPAVPTGEIPVPPVPDEHIVLFAWAATSSSADPADGPYDILSQRFTVDTLGLAAFDTDPVLMATINRFEQNSPSGALNAGRFLIITWTDYSLSGSDASYSSIRARFLPNGWLLQNVPE